VSYVIKVENLKAYYQTSSYGIYRKVRAVDNVSFDIEKSDILGIVGESGCGKSTLTKALYGNFTPPLTFIEGIIKYHFQDLDLETSPTKNELKDYWWNKISYIPQASQSVLTPTRKIRDILNDLMISHGRFLDEKEIVEYLNSIDLPSRIINAYPFELSGGMRQRVVIALATIFKPEIILADEPTSALDVVVQKSILELLEKIQKENMSTLVFVTHDISIIVNLANKIAVMYGGKLVEIGRVDHIIENPLHPYTRFLISSVPQIGDKTEKKSIPGYPPNLSTPPSGCRFHPRCPYSMAICKKQEPKFLEYEKDHKVACFLLTSEDDSN